MHDYLAISIVIDGDFEIVSNMLRFTAILQYLKNFLIILGYLAIYRFFPMTWGLIIITELKISDFQWNNIGQTWKFG